MWLRCFVADILVDVRFGISWWGDWIGQERWRREREVKAILRWLSPLAEIAIANVSSQDFDVAAGSTFGPHSQRSGCDCGRSGLFVECF